MDKEIQNRYTVSYWDKKPHDRVFVVTLSVLVYMPSHKDVGILGVYSSIEDAWTEIEHSLRNLWVYISHNKGSVDNTRLSLEDRSMHVMWHDDVLNYLYVYTIKPGRMNKLRKKCW